MWKGWGGVNRGPGGRQVNGRGGIGGYKTVAQAAIREGGNGRGGMEY